MDALELLRQQAERVDTILTQVFAPVTLEQARWKGTDSLANPIAPTFLHIYSSEDSAIQKRYQNRSTIYEAGGWRERLGFDPSSAWSELSVVDLIAARDYAKEVRAATKRYLETLDPAELERQFESPLGLRSMAVGLSLVLLIHKSTHMGEISAALGAQGLKGFPF